MATLVYRRSKGKQLEYEIKADRHGSYTISLDGKPIKVMGIGDYFGRPRWGSKKLQAEAFEAAKSSVERLLTDEG